MLRFFSVIVSARLDSPAAVQPMEIYVDDEARLTLHGLQQHYVQLTEKEKNRKLTDLLDALEFNQVVIFMRTVQRATELDRLLNECNFPSICIHRHMSQEERYTRHLFIALITVVSRDIRHSRTSRSASW